MTSTTEVSTTSELTAEMDALDAQLRALRSDRDSRIGWADDNDWDESNVVGVF